MKVIKVILSCMLLELGILGGSFSVEGCAAHQPVAAAIPGQTSTLDGQTYRALLDIQAVIDTYKGRVAAGTFTATAVIAQSMTDLETAYNVTHNLWLSYHEATAATQQTTAAALQSAYDNMQTKYSAALSSGAPIVAPTTGAK
jgi:hypothetical protein